MTLPEDIVDLLPQSATDVINDFFEKEFIPTTDTDPSELDHIRAIVAEIVCETIHNIVTARKANLIALSNALQGKAKLDGLSTKVADRLGGLAQSIGMLTRRKDHDPFQPRALWSAEREKQEYEKKPSVVPQSPIVDIFGHRSYELSGEQIEFRDIFHR